MICIKRIALPFFFVGWLSLLYGQVFNMGDVPFTDLCNGTLYDSGGPSGDYGNDEDLTFTICPQTNFACLSFEVIETSIELDFDYLYIHAGNQITDPLVATITGSVGGFSLENSSPCITLHFVSDESAADEGFELNWSCSPDACTNPAPVSCNDPAFIPSVPFSQTGLTTCNAGNTVAAVNCGPSGWLNSEDYVFQYDSPGQECISISVTGASPGTGIALINDCSTGECLAQAGGMAGSGDPTLEAVFIEQPGSYYVVIDHPSYCTSFDIAVAKVECPVVFPAAANCGEALSLNGCGDLPAVISVAQGAGDPGFLQTGVNMGCWEPGFPYNYTWFFFQAQSNGQFGFVMEAADPMEASDIDFQIWGPIGDPADACDFAQNQQPIRSSFADGEDPTGLATVHPALGTPVTDLCEDVNGDDFVAPINVVDGEYYLVLINDWGGQITSGAVSIDFNSTTQGLLNAEAVEFGVTSDTLVCPGDTIQLSAAGGDVYQWLSNTALSCLYCPDPLVVVNDTGTYHVAIHTICKSDTLEVKTGVFQADAGTDTTVCLGGSIRLEASGNLPGSTYEWTGPAGFVNCTNCPDPLVTGLSPGTFAFILTASNATCSVSDTMLLQVLPAQAPQYQVTEDTQICIGDTLELGAPPFAGTQYSWVSDPAGFTSDESNPSVVPSTGTTYYLEVVNDDCPFTAFDSVQVGVSNIPLVSLIPDTVICPGTSLVLNQLTDPGVTYQWSASAGSFASMAAQPEVSPSETTTFFLTATRGACEIKTLVHISVAEEFTLEVFPAGGPFCAGDSVLLAAFASGDSLLFSWTDEGGNIIGSESEILINAVSSASYTVTAMDSPGNCFVKQQIVQVDVWPPPVELISVQLLDLDDVPGFYEGEEVQITTDVIPYPIPGAIYTWYLDGIEIAVTTDTSSGSFFLPDISGDAAEVEVSVVLELDNGCVYTLSERSILLDNPVEVPNVFTPNSDGINDIFTLQSLVPTDILEFKIWDRWGKQVFDLSDNTGGWDGTVAGDEALSDVYIYRMVYRIRGSGQPGMLLKGNVTLLR